MTKFNPSWPRPVESSAYAAVARLCARTLAAYRDRLNINTRRDDVEDSELFNAMLRDLLAGLQGLRPEMQGALREMYLHGRADFARLFRADFGQDPIFNEPWAARMIGAELDELMQKLGESAAAFTARYRDLHIEARRKAGRPGWSRADVAKKAAKLESGAKSRAAFHVRNRLGNLLHDTTFQRFADFGVEEYEWINMGDRRVRGNPGGLYPNARYSHWHRGGRIYRIGQPPPDGEPGEADGCRCLAKPVWPDYRRRKNVPLWLWFLVGAAVGAAEEAMREPA